MEIDLPSFQTDIILQSRIEQIFTRKQTMKWSNIQLVVSPVVWISTVA